MSSIASTSGCRWLRRLDQRAHGGEHPVAHLLRVLGVEAAASSTTSAADLDPERPGDQRRDALRRLVGLVGDQRLDPAAQLAPGELGVVGVDDLELARG